MEKSPSLPTAERTCTRCGQPGEFYRGKAECKRCSIARARAWQLRNPERAAETRERNRERRRASNRRQHERTKNDPVRKEARRRGMVAWREANRERHRAEVKAWRQTNRDRYRRRQREYQQRRRLGRDDQAIAYADILMEDRCSYCDDPAEAIDHIVPRAGGGDNAWNNLTAACWSCNSKKHATPLLFWLARRP